MAGGSALRSTARGLVRAWLRRLSAPCASVAARRTRNAHARALLAMLEGGEVSAPFNCAPPATTQALPAVPGAPQQSEAATHVLSNTALWDARRSSTVSASSSGADGAGAVPSRALAVAAATGGSGGRGIRPGGVASLSDNSVALVAQMGARLGASTEEAAELKWRSRLAEERLGDLQAMVDRVAAERDDFKAQLHEARTSAVAREAEAMAAIESRHAEVVDQLQRAAVDAARAAEEKHAAAAARQQEDHDAAMRRLKQAHAQAIEELTAKYHAILLQQTGRNFDLESELRAGEAAAQRQQRSDERQLRSEERAEFEEEWRHRQARAMAAAAPRAMPVPAPSATPALAAAGPRPTLVPAPCAAPALELKSPARFAALERAAAALVAAPSTAIAAVAPSRAAAAPRTALRPRREPIPPRSLESLQGSPLFGSEAGDGVPVDGGAVDDFGPILTDRARAAVQAANAWKVRPPAQQPERPGAALSHMIDADFASVLGDFGKRTLSAQSRAADAAQAAALEEAHRARQQLQKALQRQPAA